MTKIRGIDLSLIMSNRIENNVNVLMLINREIDKINEIERMPRLSTPNMQDYFQDNDDTREVNIGCIDPVKTSRKMRFLSLNPHGFRLFDQRKVIIMQQAINNLSIDVLLL